jgi:hypothetical protein
MRRSLNGERIPSYQVTFSLFIFCIVVVEVEGIVAVAVMEEEEVVLRRGPSVVVIEEEEVLLRGSWFFATSEE